MVSRSTLRGRRLRCEPLEQRTLLAVGSIAGTVFEDLDADGVQDAGEVGLADWTVVLEQGDAPAPLLTIPDPTPRASEKFGFSISGSGSNLVIGDQYDDAGGPATGSVFVFDAATGALQQSIINPSADTDDRFGKSVAAADGKVVIGAPLDDTDGMDAGIAYLYDVDGSQLAIFHNPNPEIGQDGRDDFGQPVIWASNNVLIGAHGEDLGAVDAGAVYLFDPSGTLLHTFLNPFPMDYDNFGDAAAASGDKIFIAAHLDDAGATDTGTVYMFDNAGQLSGVIDNPTPEAGDQFGRRIAASGEHVLISAWYDDEGGTDAGAAYLFDSTTGDLLHTFLNPSPHESDLFGSALSFVGDLVAIGARNDDTFGENGGVVYLFDPSSGALVDTLVEPAPSDEAYFGRAMTALDDQLWVAATRPTSDSGGAAYAFEVPAIAATNSQGEYTFTGLETGTYEVREIVQPGYTQTAPGGDGTHSATLADGGNLTGLDFGNRVEAIKLFSDSFENGQWDGKWVEDSQNDWFTSTQRETDGSYSAEVDGGATNATLTMAQPVDMTPYGSAELTFDWYIESGFDSGEYLALDFSTDGSNWTEIERLDGNVDQENTWHNETIDVDPAYLTGDFKIRFRAQVSGSREDANVDNVQLIATSLAGPSNVAPVAVDNTYSVAEDGSLNVAEPGVLTDDTDADGDPLTASLLTGPTDGTLALSADGSFTYTPDADFNGADSFTYRAFDGADYSNTAVVSITIDSVDDAPVAGDDTYIGDQDTPLNVTLPGVLANDTDPDGDTLSAVLDSGPTNGSLTLGTDGSFDYTPNPSFFGTDTFTYTANDGDLDSNVATVTITVNRVNNAPAAFGDIHTLNEDTALSVTAPGVLGNDTDADGDPLNAVLVTAPTDGSLTLNTDGSFTYDPDANFNGTDSFTYKANDGMADSNVATVLLTVNSVNDAPVAMDDDAYRVNQNDTLNVDDAGVLANDSDVDEDALSASLVAGPANGELTLNPDGSFAYTPNDGFSGADSFTYMANDGTANSDVATVSIAVNSAETVVFSDSFEAGQWNGQWAEDSQNDWFTSTQRATDGSYSAEVDGSATDATLTMAAPIDLTAYGTATLTFDWLIEKGYDTGEYLALDVYDGTWHELARLRGNVDAENTWHQETIDVSSYMAADFQIRFRAKVSGSREDANVDNVQIVAGGTSPASATAADLALLSWFDLDASDDDETDPLTESLVDDLALMLV
ncbi:MAG: tandem-95 repeat protein [Planctomycetes bacterium]|nr:tandem-95 repeat protein [Planctomycetota bacterium]